MVLVLFPSGFYDVSVDSLSIYAARCNRKKPVSKTLPLAEKTERRLRSVVALDESVSAASLSQPSLTRRRHRYTHAASAPPSACVLGSTSESPRSQLLAGATGECASLLDALEQFCVPNDEEGDCFPRSLAHFVALPVHQLRCRAWAASQQPGLSWEAGAPTTEQHVHAYAAALAGELPGGILVIHQPAACLMHYAAMQAPSLFALESYNCFSEMKCARVLYSEREELAVGHFEAVDVARCAAADARAASGAGASRASLASAWSASRPPMAGGMMRVDLTGSDDELALPAAHVQALQELGIPEGIAVQALHRFPGESALDAAALWAQGHMERLKTARPVTTPAAAWRRPHESSSAASSVPSAATADRNVVHGCASMGPPEREARLPRSEMLCRAQSARCTSPLPATGVLPEQLLTPDRGCPAGSDAPANFLSGNPAPRTRARFGTCEPPAQASSLMLAFDEAVASGVGATVALPRTTQTTSTVSQPAGDPGMPRATVCVGSAASGGANALAQPSDPTAPTRPLSAVAGRAGRCGAWFEAEPPLSIGSLAARSSMYVPLLLACAGLLGFSATAAWSRHPRAGALFREIVAALRSSPPQYLAAVAECMATLHAQRCSEGASPCPQDHDVWARCRQAERSRPLTIAESVRYVVLPDGYIPPVAQEALLIIYGREAMVELLERLSCALRNASPEANPHAVVLAPIGRPCFLEDPDGEVAWWVDQLIAAGPTRAQSVFQRVPSYAQYVEEHSLEEVMAHTVAGFEALSGATLRAAQAVELAPRLGAVMVLPLAVAVAYCSVTTAKPQYFLADLLMSCTAALLHPLAAVCPYPADPDFTVRPRYWALPTGETSAGKSPVFNLISRMFLDATRPHVELWPFAGRSSGNVFAGGSHHAFN